LRDGDGEGAPRHGPAQSPGEPRADSDVATRIGAVVDKYTIVRVLGRGGMGAVYEARHAQLARRFAIKFLLPRLATNREILRRFENEAKAAGGLEHPNLAAVTDLGRASDGSPYLVMEFLQGEDCAQLLRRSGPLPVPRAINIVVQACRGLAVAHQASIIHRDLKPENLFVTDAGDGSDLVKVLDFGIAKLRSGEGMAATATGETFGTAHYMSPEQARGASEVDERSDVWSLGIVLYELLAGRRPFEGEQFLPVIHQILSFAPPALATLRPGLPPRLIAAVERAIAKEPAARWPTVVALADALAPFAGSPGRSVPRQARPAATRITPATTSSGVASRSIAPEWIEGRPRRLLGRPRVRIALGLLLLLAAILVVARAGTPTTREVTPQASSSGSPPALPHRLPSPEPAPTRAVPPTPVAPASIRTSPGTFEQGSDRPAPAASGPTTLAPRVRKPGPGVPRPTAGPAPAPAKRSNPAESPRAAGVKIDSVNPY
jgi:eukaryotic-like serine/threonine-protein kinase